ncbi:MAG: prolipoprotein diacylglyceryl transferase [Mariprofundales bacterium]
MIHPNFDPIAISIGPLAVHWYGLMYVAGFLSVHYLVAGMTLIKNGGRISEEHFEGLFTWLILGVIIGGRLGYVFFYNAGYYIEHPIEIFYVWQGGMSFHGGFIGPIVTGLWYCHKHNLPFLWIADRFCIVAPLGLAFGRLGNFINAELWGRPTDVAWAMIFPFVDNLPRHPSQLYELALEGLLLFFILWITRKKNWHDGSRVAFFLGGYAAARMFCEMFRQPDAHLGFLFGGFLTMGMLLSSIMLVVAMAWFALIFTKKSS